MGDHPPNSRTWGPGAATAWARRKKAGRGRPRGAIPTKVSYGVIITRISEATRRPEAILVRGRYTDAFSEFVHGRYSSKKLETVARLLDKMSVHERLDVISLNFGQMWYRIWLTTSRRDLYNRKFSKFQASWMRDDGGAALRALVCASRPLAGGDGTRLEFWYNEELQWLKATVRGRVRGRENEVLHTLQFDMDGEIEDCSLTFGGMGGPPRWRPLRG